MSVIDLRMHSSFFTSSPLHALSSFFFFNDTATTEIYTLSLHDALPILPPGMQRYIELCDILGKAPAALTVTIPTPESRDAVRRAMRAAVEHGSDLLGI